MVSDGLKYMFEGKKDHPEENIVYPYHIKEKASHEKFMKIIKEIYEGKYERIRNND